MSTNDPMAAVDSTLSYPRFLIYGDSITEYSFNQFPAGSKAVQFSLGAALTDKYTRRLDVLQRGYSGYNSEFSRILLPKILSLEHDARPDGSKIKIMTLFLGSNDAAMAGPEKVVLARFSENMEFLIKYVLSKGIKLILIGPAWHNTERCNKTYPDDIAQGIYRTTENNLRYSNALKLLAETHGVPFICLYDQMAKYDENGDFNELLSDGIHFSGKGYQMLFDCIMQTIEDEYPELHPSNLPRKLPNWNDADLVEILKHI